MPRIHRHVFQFTYGEKLTWLINQVQVYNLSVAEEMKLAETLGLNINQENNNNKGDK